MEYECHTLQKHNVRTPCLVFVDSVVDGRYIEARRAKDRMHELAMFGGYKFESLCTLEKTWDESTREEIETRNENVVDNIQQYCSVVRTQLGSSTIIMGGEVDCLWGTVPLRLDIQY